MAPGGWTSSPSSTGSSRPTEQSSTNWHRLSSVIPFDSGRLCRGYTTIWAPAWIATWRSTRVGTAPSRALRQSHIVRAIRYRQRRRWASRAISSCSTVSPPTSLVFRLKTLGRCRPITTRDGSVQGLPASPARRCCAETPMSPCSSSGALPASLARSHVTSEISRRRRTRRSTIWRRLAAAASAGSCPRHATSGEIKTLLATFRDLRVYYTHPAAPGNPALSGAGDTFAPRCRVEWLQASLCRAELLVEIEGLAVPPGP